MKKFAVLLALIIALAGVFISWSARKEIPPPADLKPEAVSSRLTLNGFYTNGRGTGSSYSFLAGRGRLLDEVSPLWYHVGGDGSLSSGVDREALELARQSGLKVIPLVALSPGGRRVLLDPAARKKAAAAVAGAVREMGYDGVNIDFELIKRPGENYLEEKEGLTLFISDLGQMIGPLGKRLDLCVIPPSRPPSHLAPIYDYQSQAGLVQRMVLMAYDYSHPGSDPGPIAPLPWVEENIGSIISLGVPAEKISLGIAAYGYDWPAGKPGGSARSAAEILRAAREGGLEVGWHDHWQEDFLTHTRPGGEPREVWFESGRAAALRMDLAKKYRLAGISVWRLGYEDDSFWEAATQRSER